MRGKNIDTHSLDSYPEDEQAQIECSRKASPAKRFAIVEELSRAAIEGSRDSIRRDYPNANEEEIGLIFVEIHYGKKLADGVRADLERRNRK